MALTIVQKPLAEVTSTLSNKTPIGSKLRSAEWANVPDQLREEAFQSAGVESVRALAEAQAGLRKILELSRDANGAISMDRSKWIAEMQKLANRLGLRNTDPNKRGGLQDFGSERRLQLIFEQQIGSAQSKAYYLSGQDPDVLDAWPAQELIRLREPKGGASARRNWRARWLEAAKAVGWVGVARNTERMIALKTSPIWVALSRFNRPWPPFDFGSGMGLEEIDREEAEALGLLKPGDVITPSVERDEEERRASVKGLGKDMIAALKHVFGDQIQIEGDTARWKKGALPPKPTPKPKAPTAPKVPPAIDNDLPIVLPGRDDGPGERIPQPDEDLSVVQKAVGDGPGEPLPEKPIANNPRNNEIEVTPNDTRPDRKELQRIAERGQQAFAAGGFEDDGKPGGADAARQGAAFGAEVAAVASGRKQLFHEQLGPELSAAIAAELSKKLPAHVGAFEREGHLYVVNRKQVPQSDDELHAASLAGDNGEWLGYGNAHLNEPGTVIVVIEDTEGNYIGGFHAFPQEAETFGRARAADYSDAMGIPVRMKIIERKK